MGHHQAEGLHQSLLGKYRGNIYIRSKEKLLVNELSKLIETFDQLLPAVFIGQGVNDGVPIAAVKGVHDIINHFIYQMDCAAVHVHQHIILSLAEFMNFFFRIGH